MKKIKGKTVVFYSLIVIVFLAILTWIFFPSANTAAEKKAGGLNTQLPGANVKGDTAKDKLSFYSAASQDSIKRAEQIRMDPNRQDTITKTTEVVTNKTVRIHTSAVHYENDPLDAKIKYIQRQLSSSKQSDYQTEDTRPAINQNQRAAIQPAPDPEMDALNGTLEKILDIQHPERVKAKSEEKKTAVFIVSKEPGNTDNSFFGAGDTTNKREVFYNETAHTKDVNANAIPAVIHATQIVQAGSIIKFRLLTNIYVAGLQIPSGSFVFGITSLNNEQLSIHISSIGYENNALPVSLSVYSMDGLPGIYAPGSITRDVAKQSTDQGLQSIGILNMDPSLKAQAAAAGIGAAKSLLSKKVKQVSVTVKAGYKVLLKDDNQQNANNE